MYKIRKGKAHPLGASVNADGVNFSIYSENATAVQLLLFRTNKDSEPFQVINFDPLENMTFHFWHVFVEGLNAGIFYNYRIDGPRNTEEGHKFNFNKVLVDPYSKGNDDTLWNRVDACGEKDNLATSFRSAVIDETVYNWEGDQPLGRPLKDAIIYEMHVGGFTRNPNSKSTNPGTFKGIIEKIPYLKELGINTVELLPVFEFDEKEILKITNDGTVLKNYWGYSTVGFFAPNSGYCVNPAAGEHLNEFRDMVKALHKAGIEVILDVVFNHSNEGNHEGPTINFKGVDNSVYYFLNPNDKRYYYDYSGCGNTINANNPIVEKFITDCLTFWAREMHVDGFRFDEGSILSRGEDGSPLKHPPLLWGLELSEIFADTKLIAEAWDAAGLYQIGSFPGYRWSEWNGKYRDSVRKFLKGDSGVANEVADRIAGSSSLYKHSRHKPTNSINFVSCHDGFNLYDLVSYNYKHNHENGENNQDGINDNISWNSGTEGDTDNISIINFRKKRVKNFVSVLMLSIGVPMILSGDEVGKSQNGNNNVYCQDNEISWFDWDLIDKNSDLFLFFKKIIAFRNKNTLLRRETFFDGSFNTRGLKDIDWHGCKLYSPGWDNSESKVLSYSLASFNDNEPDIHVMINMDYQDLKFEMFPEQNGRKWFRFIDTSLNSPEDIADDGDEELINSGDYQVKSYSVVVLISKKNKGGIYD
jgi:glycogen operon protein